MSIGMDVVIKAQRTADKMPTILDKLRAWDEDWSEVKRLKLDERRIFANRADALEFASVESDEDEAVAVWFYNAHGEVNTLICGWGE